MAGHRKHGNLNKTSHKCETSKEIVGKRLIKYASSNLSANAEDEKNDCNQNDQTSSANDDHD